jgi:hypothetical protein
MIGNDMEGKYTPAPVLTLNLRNCESWCTDRIRAELGSRDEETVINTWRAAFDRK